MKSDGLWLFGYGSVIYRPGFDFVERRTATLRGWARRFSQKSDDHRGTPEFPGRVVTLVPEPSSHLKGVAFRLDPASAPSTLLALDHREKAGYERTIVDVTLEGGPITSATVYIAHRGNDWDAGHESQDAIVATIVRARGPSGTNVEYLFRLADALRSLGAHDPHVFALEAAARVALNR
jgi:cation transport protein ChaC